MPAPIEPLPCSRQLRSVAVSPLLSRCTTAVLSITETLRSATAVAPPANPAVTMAAAIFASTPPFIVTDRPAEPYSA